jgi:plastocyanin
VSLRGRHPRLYRAALALGVVSALALPASAGGQAPSTATGTARDGPPRWEANSGTLALGGTVTFTYPTGISGHSLSFTNPPASPSCTPAWPTAVRSAPWTTTCSFSVAGAYNYLCTVPTHTGMTGTIVVEGGAGGPPPGGENPPGGGGGGSGGGSGGNTPGGSPTQPGSLSVKVARRQTGTTVRGSVTTSVDNSRLAIKVLVANRLLAKKPPSRKVSVGSLRKQIANAGKTSFAVKLNRAARRALNRRDRLVVALRITLTPPGGQATTKTARVTLRPA